MPVSSSEKRMTIHLKLHAIIDGDGEIVGGGMVTRTCRGGPTIKADIFDTVTAPVADPGDRQSRFPEGARVRWNDLARQRIKPLPQKCSVPGSVTGYGASPFDDCIEVLWDFRVTSELVHHSFLDKEEASHG